MLYRTMPKIKDELSLLGFGCMRLPVNKDNSIDKPRAIAQIRSAVDQGVNYFDTAWPYHAGQSQPLLGEALQDGYREKVKIATKLPSWMVKDREHMDYFLDEQLKLLKTDVIDFYLMHALDAASWDRLKQMGVLDFIEKARQSGRIKNVGFSFHGFVEDFETIVDDYPWEFCQIQYNYLDEEFQAGTRGLKYAAKNDLGIIVMEPLRGGSLGMPKPPAEVEALWAQAEAKRTPVEWALRWVMDNPEVTMVLSGMNEEAHIEENIKITKKALPGTLSAEDHSIIKKVAGKYKELMKVNCTGCEYCMPCPEGVNIPGSFDSLNKLYLYKNEQDAKFMYVIRCGAVLSAGSDTGFASQCIQCGECLEKCPQNIEIPDLLALAAEDLEDDQVESRIGMAKKMLNIE